MIQQTGIYLTSIILGIMLFFSFVVAPVTFTTLDEENARKFIRKIFPYYYNVNLVISFLVLIIFIILKTFSLNFYLILLVTLLFALSSFILTLIAVAVSSFKRRGGMGVNLAFGITLGFLFIFFDKIFGVMVSKSTFPPFLAAWLPLLIFSLLALFLLRYAKK